MSLAATEATSTSERRALNAWTGQGLALASGMAAALAQPPFGLLPGLLGYGLLLVVLDAGPAARPLRAAFFRGWAAGCGYLLISVWWIAEAFLVDVAARGWQGPFAVAFTAGGIGLFWGGAGLVYKALTLRSGSGASRILVFAAALSLFEWLRGHVLTGFPWDLPGETWRAGSPVSEFAALVGAYGLTFVTVAIGASVAVLAPGRDPSIPTSSVSVAPGLVSRLHDATADTRLRRQTSHHGPPQRGRGEPGEGVQRSARPAVARVVVLGLAVASLICLWGVGAWRLSQPTPLIPPCGSAWCSQASARSRVGRPQCWSPAMSASWT